MDANRFLTYSLQDQRLIRILAAAIEAVEPGRIVRQRLEKIILPSYNHLFLLGIGKAAEAMTMAAADILDDFTEALIITKHSMGEINNISPQSAKRVTIMETGHPVPDERSLAAGQAVLDFTSRIQENDLLICLISGGGSALAVAPRNGLALADIQILTSSLLTQGASIDKINILRGQLDLLKGGGLAGMTKGKILSLILSDVIGDHLEIIASGPTVPGPIPIEQVRIILDRYHLEKLVPRSKINIISNEAKFSKSNIKDIQNIIVANNKSAIQAAKEQAIKEGLIPEIINTDLHGEASVAGRKLAQTLKNEMTQRKRPFCLISGGETTVTIHGNGKGGRNQELALAAVDILDNLEKAMLVSLATDGNDGPTEAAGAVVDGYTKRRANKLGMVTAEYLSRNDAFPYFDALGDLLKPGYSGTNVNDLIFLFGL